MQTTSLPRARLTDDAVLRLVCLPYAGGGSAVFHRWRTALPAGVDLVPLCLPGHDGRLAESPRTDLYQLARELATEIEPVVDRPYVLLGHSLGAWIAFELARELRRRNQPQPAQLIVAAARPPDTALSKSPLHKLPDAEFVAAMQLRYGGIPAAILGNAELLQLLLPVLRADIQMVETYHHAPEPPLDVEIIALGGTEDPAVSPAQLAEWRRHTARNCSVRQFPGGHFFLFRGDNQQQPSAANEPPTPALRTVVTSIARIMHDDNSSRQTWPATAEPPALTADEVHVWSVQLDDAPTTWTNQLAVLAADEHARAERFRLEDARRRFVVARSALRKLLGVYMRMPPDEVAFDYDTTGKPRLKHAASPPDLQFNLAHSGEMALIAITRGCEVGVDVERLREVHHWQEISERYFHRDEIAAIRELPPAGQLAAFMRCWTGKEAVLKALGTGVTRPLDFFVGNSQPEAGSWLDVPAAAGATSRCWLLPLAPAADYIGAVVCIDTQRRPRCFSIT